MPSSIMLSVEQVRALLAEGTCEVSVTVACPKSLMAQGPDLSRARADKLWGVSPGLHVPVARYAGGDTVSERDGLVTERLYNPWSFFAVDGAEPVILYVREAWFREPVEDDVVYYRASDSTDVAWRSAATMPKKYSRMRAQVVHVVPEEAGGDWVWRTTLKLWQAPRA